MFESKGLIRFFYFAGWKDKVDKIIRSGIWHWLKIPMCSVAAKEPQ